ncbi:hypothetical protein EW026_g1803 [Hermanssonia centrifuga]|uniref:Uncharacterized protein n=1 Tax=Hermanssonia centrifuga TaxID=98765 RepID=A0A4S4KR50_9APHY|nr:hypothetical protein EW026_g1803 [Hermanssonia centrifuga]
MARFRDLALFRRAIKICEKSRPENLSVFKKLIVLETPESDDLGIMETQTRTTRTNKIKAAVKTKPPPRRKSTRKQRYVFVSSILKTKTYQDYFDPSPEVEKRLLSLADLKPKKSHRKKDAHEMDQDIETLQPDLPPAVETPNQAQVVNAESESQTQAETQLVIDTQDKDTESISELKRKTLPLSQDQPRKTKKVKISMAPAVDLGD